MNNHRRYQEKWKESQAILTAIQWRQFENLDKIDILEKCTFSKSTQMKLENLLSNYHSRDWKGD